MSRRAREKSYSGIYHIMIRGINQQDIFEDDEDRQRFIETIERVKKETDIEIYAYCLMNNHIHLLIKEKNDEVSKIIKKIGTSYVYYFNWKNERSGHLFQDRYKSETVENDEYLYTVIRYIHQNPVKAGLSGLADYKWSSYNNYINKHGIIDTEFFLGMFGNEKEEAIKRYEGYMKQTNEDKCLEMEEQIKLTDEKARESIKEIGSLINISDIQKIDVESRNRILRKVKEIKGISIFQIHRVTGINRNAIIKA